MTTNSRKGDANTDDEHRDESPQRDASAEVVCRAVGKDGSEESSGLEQRDNIGLDQTSLRRPH